MAGMVHFSPEKDGNRFDHISAFCEMICAGEPL